MIHQISIIKKNLLVISLKLHASYRYHNIDKEVKVSTKKGEWGWKFYCKKKFCMWVKKKNESEACRWFWIQKGKSIDYSDTANWCEGEMEKYFCERNSQAVVCHLSIWLCCGEIEKFYWQLMGFVGYLDVISDGWDESLVKNF